MTNYRFILEPYKGQNTRYICPNCRSKEKTFSRYIDTEMGKHVAWNVGRCNRENNCGYHYTPKQYFEDKSIKFENANFAPRSRSLALSKPKIKPNIDNLFFKQSLQDYEKNNFVQFLINRFGLEVATKAVERFYIGTSDYWDGATIFYQIDINGNVRAGKIMMFNSENCKRLKDKNFWVHSLLKIEIGEQCFFGEHQLKDKSKIVIIVESEKTAILGSIFFSQFIWLASCGGDGLNPRKCGVLKGRDVVLFPDISKPKMGKLTFFEKWTIKAKEFGFRVSDLLERKATEEQRLEGLDIADYLLNYEIKDFETTPRVLSPKKRKPILENEFSEGSLEVFRIVQERKYQRLELTREESYMAIQYFIDNNTDTYRL
ncbi:MAG TPA: DUF6371 domain-containing protein [Flavobacterium sp.]